MQIRVNGGDGRRSSVKVLRRDEHVRHSVRVQFTVTENTVVVLSFGSFRRWRGGGRWRRSAKVKWHTAEMRFWSGLSLLNATTTKIAGAGCQFGRQQRSAGLVAEGRNGGGQSEVEEVKFEELLFWNHLSFFFFFVELHAEWKMPKTLYRLLLMRHGGH